MDALGNHAPTPAAGTYVIYKPTGVVEVCNNEIDCSDDGWGQGGVGIFCTQDAGASSNGGLRFWCHHNTLRNCDTDGIFIDFAGVPAMEQLLIYDNTGHDDQGTPTMVNLLTFNGTPNYTQLILRNNQAGDGVTTSVNGLTTGVWQVNGGLVPLWAGYGTPEGVVTAPVGAMYQRVDGGASAVLYMKESGTGTTGWVAYASPFSGAITNDAQVSPTGAGATTLASFGAPLTVVANSTSQPGINDSDFWSRVRKVRYQSAAAANSVTSLRQAGGANFLAGGDGSGFRVVWRFSICDTVLVGTANMFVGLGSSLAAPTDVAPSTLTNIMGVGVDNGDTTLQLYAAGAAAQARIDLGVNFPANTTNTDVYEVEFISVGGAGDVAYKVTRLNTGDIATGTLTGAQLSSAALACQAYRSNGGAGSTVAFCFHELFTSVPV
jgi:hypothetical protein